MALIDTALGEIADVLDELEEKLPVSHQLAQDVQAAIQDIRSILERVEEEPEEEEIVGDLSLNEFLRDLFYFVRDEVVRKAPDAVLRQRITDYLSLATDTLIGSDAPLDRLRNKLFRVPLVPSKA